MRAHCRTTLLGAALMLALSSIVLAQPSQLAASRATLIQTYGDVQTRHAAAGYKAARVGEELLPGDGVKTGANARAQLAIGSSQYVRMDQNSQILITQLQQGGMTSLKTIVGGVWVTIQKALGVPAQFEVQTPSVVAGARGTVFRCEVGSSGDTDVYVYEGEVEVSGAQGAVRVAPEQFARARLGIRPALSAINADEDEGRSFVRFNRHCEVLNGVGNPTVLVALSMVEQTRPQAAIATSDRLVAELRQLGFIVQTAKPEQLREATFDSQGVLRLKPRTADYLLVGAIKVQPPSGGPGAPGTGVAIVRARLVDGNDNHLVSSADARRVFSGGRRRPFGLPGGSDTAGVKAALESLGQDIAAQMAPQLLRDIVVDRPAAVRVDIATPADPRQIRALKSLLAPPQAGARLTPLPRFDGKIAFLLAGAVAPDEVARICRAGGAPWLAAATVRGRTVEVTFRAGAVPPDALLR